MEELLFCQSIDQSQVTGFEELNAHELWRLLALENVGQGVPSFSQPQGAGSRRQHRSLGRAAGVGEGFEVAFSQRPEAGLGQAVASDAGRIRLGFGAARRPERSSPPSLEVRSAAGAAEAVRDEGGGQWLRGDPLLTVLLLGAVASGESGARLMVGRLHRHLIVCFVNSHCRILVA